MLCRVASQHLSLVMHHNYQAIVNTFGGLGTFCFSFTDDDDHTVLALKKRLEASTSITTEEQRITSLGGRPLIDSDDIFCDSSEPRFLNLSLRLRGGKGGFGSMLRAQGGRMNAQKTTNFEACRDLQGRRIRTVNDAKRLQAELDAIPEREKEKREKLQKKIEKALKEYEPRKHLFDDNQFLEDREQMVENVKNAVGGLLKKQKVDHKPVKAAAIIFDDEMDSEDEDDEEEDDDDELKYDNEQTEVTESESSAKRTKTEPSNITTSDGQFSTGGSSKDKGKGKAFASSSNSNGDDNDDDNGDDKDSKKVLSDFLSTNYDEEYDSEEDDDFEINEDDDDDEEEEEEGEEALSDEDILAEQVQADDKQDTQNVSASSSKAKGEAMQSRKRKDREE
ncbi:telomere stability and silencing-domain-containing protein [Radiomyces spectabilis]|uniref:telomere stability and silencing-domain-containing protein n=1 Tax=Radiomyces spectabilis TaxID=64574 RepID=UPI00221FCCE0|nr:telomere stability and silencing-domain-containing protein [Radiomyces spectabilis]KAI8367461.1 telomere stability and silencing-domain-containing protein [Radiomyces spectabilis]